MWFCQRTSALQLPVLKICSADTRGLRAMIRRRSAFEPAIGHMKTDGKLDRNWLQGALSDAMHAVLCGAGHNLRMILRRLRLFYAFMLALVPNSALRM